MRPIELWPNPGHLETSVRFFLTQPEPRVLVQVFDAQGRLVRVLNDGPRDAGLQSVLWDGRDFTGRQLAAGIYVVRLVTPAGTFSEKLTWVR